MTRRFARIYGVDFSGAALAGRNIWVARCTPLRRLRLKLEELHRLEDLAGSAAREPALAHLVKIIESSDDALWAIDCPFGMPVELFDDGSAWPDQLKLLESWAGGAYDFGLWCLERAKQLGGAMHIRRTTDVESRAPFDCYHYRMVYQTFHGMRDVVAKLARQRGTMIAPLQPRGARTACRISIEACPSSTLKRLNLPHQNYKQPAGGALTGKRRRTRAFILTELTRHIDLSDRYRRAIMRNPGGDALDAVIAAVGGYQAWFSADHRAIARHARYPLEGRIYA